MQNSHSTCNKNDVVIRRACAGDIPYLYEICLKTGLAGKDATASFRDPYLLGQYYAVPYFFFQPALCFVAENQETRKPAGYILGTSDSSGFYEFMNTSWLPYLRHQLFTDPAPVPASEAEAGLIATIAGNEEKTLYPGYPAHLHIDLLPELQGKGCGRLLMERMLKELKDDGISGVHLGVDGKNTNAIGFYGKMGFTAIEAHEWGLVLGKKLR